jgi:hypothetical protein
LRLVGSRTTRGILRAAVLALGFRGEVNRRVAEARGQLEPAGVGHGRVAETAAKLCAAAAVYLECAEAQGALTEAERLSLRD